MSLYKQKQQTKLLRTKLPGWLAILKCPTTIGLFVRDVLQRKRPPLSVLVFFNAVLSRPTRRRLDLEKAEAQHFPSRERLVLVSCLFTPTFSVPRALPGSLSFLRAEEWAAETRNKQTTNTNHRKTNISNHHKHTVGRRKIKWLKSKRGRNKCFQIHVLHRVLGHGSSLLEESASGMFSFLSSFPLAVDVSMLCVTYRFETLSEANQSQGGTGSILSDGLPLSSSHSPEYFFFQESSRLRLGDP